MLFLASKAMTIYIFHIIMFLTNILFKYLSELVNKNHEIKALAYNYIIIVSDTFVYVIIGNYIIYSS